VATDESTDIIDIVQVAVFIWGVNEDFQIAEELLELVPMKRKTGADEVFSWIGDIFLQIQIALGKNGWVC
jgi:hypothetical protein